MVLHSLKVHLPVLFGIPTEPRSPAGSDNQFIEVVITRTGRARTFVEPLTLHLCIDSDSTSSECRDVETYGTIVRVFFCNPSYIIARPC